jgi:hypothetical protein
MVTMSTMWATTREAEHAHLRSGPEARWAATRFVPGRQAVMLVTDAGDRQEGDRAFVYAGSDALDRPLTVAEVLAHTEIDQVRALGGVLPPDDAILDPLGFVRPVVRAGRLVLDVRPAADDRWVPFEQASPTPCCADHG